MQVELFFEDGHEEVNRDGDPDLALDGVLAGSEKRLDLLLDPLEEEFDLPARFVKLSDDRCGQDKVVGQECKPSGE